MRNTDILPGFQAHICPRCGASYILFKKGALCPNCKFQENIESHSHFNFVTNLLDLMKIHKRRYNRYMPNVWFVESVCDEISQTCFYVFDRLELEDGPDPVHKIKKILDDMDWKGKAYLKIHAREIIAELYKRYLAKKPKHSLFSKIRSMLVL